MIIVHVAPPFLAIDKTMKYGGTEREILSLSRKQEEAGYHTKILAPADSTVDGLIPTTRSIGVDEIYTPTLDKHKVRANSWGKLEHVAKVLEYNTTNDDLFFHVHDDYLVPFLPLLKVPSVVTLHSPYEDFWPAEEYPELMAKTRNLIALSQSHKRIYESYGYTIRGVVYNGIDVENFPFSVQKDDYLLSLSAIATHKGQKVAVDVALASRRNLIIAGNIGDQDYFNREIKPHLHYDLSSSEDKLAAYRALPPGRKVVYVGAVNDEQKKPLLARASAFLMPILWEEPFGLVVVESLACGTPVIAFSRGSMPELIQSGKTGYLCTTPAEMVQTLERITSIEHALCRRDVEERFSSNKAAQEYLTLYQEIAGTNFLQHKPNK